MEHILDRFDSREEKHAGDIIIKEGDVVGGGGGGGG